MNRIPDYSENQSAALAFAPLTNPLEPFIPFIHKLIESLGDNVPVSAEDTEGRLLEALRNVADADCVCILSQQKKEWTLRSAAHRTSNHTDSRFVDTLSSLTPLFSRDIVLSANHFGVRTRADNGGAVVIPLKSTPPCELLIIMGVPADSPLTAEPCRHILTALYEASENFSSTALETIEAAILDRLKSYYSFVPIKMYNRRFELFWTQLQRMDVRFQPIVRLSRENPYVCGFEALALDPLHAKSPRELFITAEKWGTKFSLELDIFFIQRAVNKYRSIHEKTRGRQRPEDVVDLSVNVYPETLLRTSYYGTVRDIIEREVIPHDKLVLEISEKLPLPSPTAGDGVSAASGEKTFRQILEKYVRELKIGFAIDDFGVGHSSVSRLAQLHPGYIKNRS
jgi:EAL domain-containing protein (putative c-di-GMP-specific phosphodiesterase class I)